MNLHRRINKLNDLIGRELGRTPFGQPIYRWDYSENLYHWMRADGYDYEAEPSGLLVARPRYERRRLALHLHDQWVICMWEAPMPEDQWRTEHGYKLEWPKQGEYYPTNVDLDPGMEPNETFTDVFIGCVKEQRKKRLIDFYEEAERAADARENAGDSELDAFLRDAMPAFVHVPGKKDHVSIPSVA